MENELAINVQRLRGALIAVRDCLNAADRIPFGDLGALLDKAMGHAVNAGDYVERVSRTLKVRELI